MTITYPPEMLPSPDEGQEAEVIVVDQEDLVKRLRDTAEILPHDVYTWLHPLITQAANELERVRSCAGEAVNLAIGSGANFTWQAAERLHELNAEFGHRS
jgi:hypothetical protein